MEEPRVPESFQQVIRLGPAVKVYRTGVPAAIGAIAGAAAVFLIAGLMLFFAVSAPFVGDVSGTRIFGPLLMLGLGLLVGIWQANQTRHDLDMLRTTAVLYEGGFAVARTGAEPAVCAWDEIRSLRSQITRPMGYGLVRSRRECVFTIDCERAGTVVLRTPLGGVEELFRLIHKQAMPRIAERLLARFQMGERLEFGPLDVSRAGGIHLPNKDLGWPEIKDVKTDGGFFLIYPTSGGFLGVISLAVGTIPNLRALEKICREALEAKPS
jgi:hypothetical protein